jgi:hypothetical protein
MLCRTFACPAMLPILVLLLCINLAAHVPRIPGDPARSLATSLATSRLAGARVMLGHRVPVKFMHASHYPSSVLCGLAAGPASGTQCASCLSSPLIRRGPLISLAAEPKTAQDPADRVDTSQTCQTGGPPVARQARGSSRCALRQLPEVGQCRAGSANVVSRQMCSRVASAKGRAAFFLLTRDFSVRRGSASKQELRRFDIPRTTSLCKSYFVCSMLGDFGSFGWCGIQHCPRATWNTRESCHVTLWHMPGHSRTRRIIFFGMLRFVNRLAGAHISLSFRGEFGRGKETSP